MLFWQNRTYAVARSTVSSPSRDWPDPARGTPIGGSAGAPGGVAAELGGTIGLVLGSELATSSHGLKAIAAAVLQ
jgi:hypothetical protein